MALKEKSIDMGHARALLSLDSPTEQIRIFNEIKENNYSVRQVEEIVRNAKEGEKSTTASAAKTSSNSDNAAYHQLKKQLTNFFQTPVQLTCGAKGNGKISIKFKNEQELERIITLFDKLRQ